MTPRGGAVERAPVVKLEGPLPAWGDGVMRARWGHTLAAVIQGPPAVDPAALVMSKRRAEPWIGREHPHVLPLLGVAHIGGREGWFYQRPRGVSVAVLTEHQARLPPIQVGAEIVWKTCEVLLSLRKDGLIHPGPTPQHVLLDDEAQITLAGFVGPAESAPIHPGEPGLVFSLGHLWATLLAGRGLTVPKEPGAHRGFLRRLIVSLLSRPGPPVPEALREGLSSMLAWEASQRPQLSAVPEVLREAAAGLGPPDLKSWAPMFLPAVRRRLEAEWEIPEDDLGRVSRDPGEETQESDLPVLELLEAEVTAASGGRASWPRDMPEHGAIPVGVGPPPEAVPTPIRLPADLFDTEQTQVEQRHPLNRWWMVGSGALLVVALLLASYVLAG